jgi:hypothetical protein
MMKHSDELLMTAQTACKAVEVTVAVKGVSI